MTLETYIPGWSSLNWRGKAAQLQQYYDQGKSELSPLERVWAVGAVLWIKGFSFPIIALILIALVPVALVGYAAFGLYWTHRGWYKQKQEVSTLGNWNPMSNLQWRLLVALAQDRGISIQEQDVSTAPREVQDACLSYKRTQESRESSRHA